MWLAFSVQVLVKVLRPTGHRIGHIGVVPQANLLAWYGNKQNLTQQKHTFTNQNKCTRTQNRHKKLEPGLVASYDIRPRNGVGIFWFRRFMILSLTYLDTYLLTARTHRGLISKFKVTNTPEVSVVQVLP